MNIAANANVFVHDKGQLKNRVRRIMHWDDNNIADALKAYEEFIQLKVALLDWEGNLLVAPIKVKKVWEQHVLDTAQYSSRCVALFGNILHYNPDEISDNEKITTTKIAYQARFSKLPSSNEWCFDKVKEITRLERVLSPKEHSLKKSREKTDRLEKLFFVDVYNVSSRKTSRIYTPHSTTIEDLKIRIQHADGIPTNQQWLTIKGSQRDAGSLAELGVVEGERITLKLRLILTNLNLSKVL